MKKVLALLMFAVIVLPLFEIYYAIGQLIIPTAGFMLSFFVGGCAVSLAIVAAALMFPGLYYKYFSFMVKISTAILSYGFGKK